MGNFWDLTREKQLHFILQLIFVIRSILKVREPTKFSLTVIILKNDTHFSVLPNILKEIDTNYI